MRKIALGLVLLGAFVFAGDDIVTRKIDSDCKNGDNRSCYTLALGYANGKGGMEKDHQKAKFYFERICRKGNESSGFFADACLYLGVIHDEAGIGVQRDYKKASESYALACDHGKVKACDIIGSMYHTGRGVPKDVAKGASYFKKACDLGSFTACYFLANYTLDNHDFNGAIQYFIRACELGKSNPEQVHNDSGVKKAWETACAMDDAAKAMSDDLKDMPKN